MHGKKLSIMNKKTLLEKLIYYSWHRALEDFFTIGTGKRDIRIILDPCRKCVVKPICKQHKNCSNYQNWFFKKIFCKHDWKVDSVLMRLPTSLMYQCSKCGSIK